MSGLFAFCGNRLGDFLQVLDQLQALEAGMAVAANDDVVVDGDAGKSGLKIEGRDALRQLIEDVQAGDTDFTMVLVYDVSRWGRFQDADESAYYEYICRRSGIAVEYCAEQFDNDGSPISTIVKGVKRAMAGEYMPLSQKPAPPLRPRRSSLSVPDLFTGS